MLLGSNRVWDYAGDNFVHRLLQNKGDGKLVESEQPSKEPVTYIFLFVISYFTYFFKNKSSLNIYSAFIGN